MGKGGLLGMKVEKIVKDKETIIKLSGAIDTPVAQDFMDAVEDCRKNHPHKIVFDFEEVPYISSSGLGVILRAKNIGNEIGSGVTLMHLGETVRNTMEMVGFIPLFDIVD